MPDGADGCVTLRKLSVYPSGHDDAGATQIGPEESGTGVKSETDTNVVNGTTYYYLAVCRAGDAWYDIVNADPEGGNAAPGTPLDPAPKNPVDVACSQGLTGKATISFTMPSPPVSDCSVRRRPDDYPTRHDDGVAVGAPLTGTGFKTVNDTGLSNGFYFYSVFCRNGSTYNDTVNNTPPDVNAASSDVL
jgi:hypothetical protein